MYSHHHHHHHHHHRRVSVLANLVRRKNVTPADFPRDIKALQQTEIIALNESAVLTFGVFPYAYDALDRASTGLRLRVDRDGALLDLARVAFRRSGGSTI